MRTAPRVLPLIFFALLIGLPPGSVHGQSLPAISVNAPPGRIYGTVTDSAGNMVVGAKVTLENRASHATKSLLTDSAGFFNFTGLAAGNYQISVTATGFAQANQSSIALAQGQYLNLPQIQLQIASTNTTVHAIVYDHALAEQQVHLQEKQRVLGVIPNFYTSYIWNAQPLTSRQKFALAWRTSIDPVTFLVTGVTAGIQQWHNDFKDYGQGFDGYAKRFGASYADGFTGIMLGGAVFPSLLHQDPRYFYKGTGSIRSRAFYAISTVVICKGDNGRWQPNYSNILGTFAAAGISNAYYPAANRGAGLTMENSLLGLASGAADALFQEFLLKKISRGVPKSSASSK